LSEDISQAHFSANSSESLNKWTLTAQLTSLSVVRYNPQGLPVCEFELEHNSEQVEAGLPRAVRCKVSALSMGVVTEQIRKLPLGQWGLWEGFLAQRSLKSNGLRFHVTSVTPHR